MLFREKLLVGFCATLFVIGVADLNTPYVNLFWERHLGFSGRFMVLQDGKIGYVNARSRLMIRPQFNDGAVSFTDIAPALSGDKWGYIDTSGRWVIGPQFSTAKQFQEERAAVSKMDNHGVRKFGFIDRRGTWMVNPLYPEVGDFSGGVAPVKSAGWWGYMDPAGKWNVDPKFEEAQDFSEDLAAVKADGAWGYVERHGLFVIRPQFQETKAFHEGRAAVMVGGRWGYIDAKGQWIVEPKFVSAGSFSDGLAVVDNSGYIGLDGRLVVASGTFKEARDFSEGLAAVQERLANKYKIGKWGYIDRQGHWVVKPRFEIARNFQGGMARVSKDKNNLVRGYIHHDGKLRWDPADWETTAVLKSFFKTVGTGLAVFAPFYVAYVLRRRQEQFYFLQTIA